MDLTTLAANPELTAALIVGVGIPFAVDLVSKQLASGRFKTLLLTALALASTALVQLISAGDVTVSGFINGFVATFTTAVVAHKGLLEPAGVTGAGGVIQNAIPGGLGTPVLPDVVPPVEALPEVVENAVPDQEEPLVVPVVDDVEPESAVTVEDVDAVGDVPLEEDLVVVEPDDPSEVRPEDLLDIGGTDADFAPLDENDVEEEVASDVADLPEEQVAL